MCLECGVNPRAAAMASAYRAGQTLESIGSEHGISRERVRQILRKNGVQPHEGGAKVAAKDRRDAKRAARDAACLRIRGMTYAEYAAVPASARRAYGRQRQNAKDRGIEWGMTLGQWWAVWRASGKLDQRGRGRGYVMARKSDAGPYAPDNVYICTQMENIRDSYMWKPAALRKRAAQWAKYEYQGRRLTVGEWALECGISASALAARIKRGWPMERALTAPLAMTNTRVRRLALEATA